MPIFTLARAVAFVVVLTCASAFHARADDFNDLASCARFASACDATICVDRIAKEFGAARKQEFDPDAEAAQKTCGAEREHKAYAAFEDCVAAGDPCDATRCDSLYERLAPLARQHEAVSRTLAKAGADCAAAPAEKPEQAARAFVDRFYFNLGSRGHASPRDIAELYAPSVTIAGDVLPRDAAAARKMQSLSGFASRVFNVREGTVNIDCDPQGNICHIDGVLDFSSASSNNAKKSDEVQRFRLKLTDARTEPHIASESEQPLALPPAPRWPATDLRSRPCDRPDALGTSRDVVVAAPEGGLHIGLESYPKTLALKPKEVALTFDDGPHAGTTAAVLDTLKAECVQATFFLIGRSAEMNPDLVKRELREGHTIGYHTWSHPARTLAGISQEEAIREIVDGFEAVDKAAYGPHLSAPKIRWFRFPGFADTPALLGWLDKRRITVFGTDLWASDWLLMTPEAELKLVIKRLDERGGGIVLFHDTRKSTVAMLPAFLRELKARGYHVVHLVPGPAAETNLRDAPPGWTSATQAIIARVLPRLLRTNPYRFETDEPAPAGTE